MVKRFKLSLRISKSSKKEPKSPEIEINDQPIAGSSAEILRNSTSEEDFYSKFNSYLHLNKSKSDASLSELDSSGSSHSTCSDSSKASSKQKKAKKLLREEGNKHIAELIAHLHSGKQLVKSKFNIDRDEIELLKTYDNAVDLDKFFEEKKPKAKGKLWRTPYFFTKHDKKNVCDCSANGLHSVNRFGEGVRDGCSISLSLPSKGRVFGDVFYRPTDWTDIFEEADKVLNQYDNLDRRNALKARRGSLLQPRFLFLSPHPEATYERVLQSANCLPLRAWTSELFIDSKESSELMDSETKRNLKWNTSVEDFRHLLSPELSHFGSDVHSMMVQAKRRMSLIPPKQGIQAIPFRRQSYQNGSIWAPIEPNKHHKKDYNKKLGVIRQNSDNSLIGGVKAVKTCSTDNWLKIPREMQTHTKRNLDELSRSLSDISIEGLTPKQVANEITLIAKELLLSIKNTEMIILLIRPQSISPDSCPDITALLGFQKRIIQLITSYLLSDPDIESIASRMAYFIEVAKELKIVRNWHSVYSVIMSFQSPPIARLKKCWHLLSDRYSDDYCDFIEMSELIKGEDCSQFDYSPPSIPLFSHMIDDLKERCGHKFYEIKQHRLRSNWSKSGYGPDTLAIWVDQQIVDLVNKVSDNGAVKRSIEKIEKQRKSSNDSQNKGIFKRFLSKSSNKEYSNSESVNAYSETTSRLSSLDSDFRVRSKYCSANSPLPSCKNIWSVQDFNKLREYDEKQILEEIARGLIHYQRNADLYYLDESNQIAKQFLLFQTYQGLQNCMKKSLDLEPPKKPKDCERKRNDN